MSLPDTAMLLEDAADRRRRVAGSANSALPRGTSIAQLFSRVL